MKGLLAIVIAAMLLFAGCTMPWDQAKPPVQNNTPAKKNDTAKNNTDILKNETIVKKNKTIIKPVERPDPFAGLPPRNASDNIADGQFHINDRPGAPINIYVINDGYADSILVNKGEFNMLVDAGNPQQAIDLLKNNGIIRINALVATRDDPGAINGIVDVLDAFPVDEYWDNNVQSNPSLVALVPPSTTYVEVLSRVAEKNIPIKHPQAGDRLSVSGMDIAILNPQSPRLRGNPDIDAIVMKISFNSFCAVLLNPTVQEREVALMGSGEDLKCDVMTYFKHGEGRDTPSLLLENNPPKDVIISVGENSDKLPSDTALTRLSMKNIKVWRTDHDGTLRVYSDGFSKYEISPVR